MSGQIQVERLMHRSSIAVAGESAAGYCLIKLCPGGNQETAPLPLSIALVLDVSGSMYEEDGVGISRLERIQQAALAAISKLKPEDTLAVVAFAHDAQVVLPSTRVADRSAAEDVIRRIDSFAVDPGGTAMDQGIALGLQEVEKDTDAGRIREVVVLTDGETSSDEPCRQLAQQAADKKIRLTLMGLGTEWNAPLIKEMSRLSDGRWCYIDTHQAGEAERVFVEEFKRLSATVLSNVEVHLRPVKEVRIKRFRQVVPEIRELKVVEAGERYLIAHLGTLEKEQARRYILEMSLPRRPDGKYVLAQMELRYQVGGGRQENNGSLPLEMQYTAAGQGYINAEVAKHIDEVQIFELNKNLQRALEAADTAEARRVAENIAKKGDLMGPRAARKTMLARQLLGELERGGPVSKKTQLAVDDAVRLTEEPSAPCLDERREKGRDTNSDAKTVESGEKL
jgi:Ca-activated chloride channel homolog